MKQPLPLELKQGLMLQINQKLYDQGLLSKSVYEQAKEKIINTHP